MKIKRIFIKRNNNKNKDNIFLKKKTKKTKELQYKQ